MIENRFFMSDDVLKEFIYKVLCKKTMTYGIIISSLSFLLLIYSTINKDMFMSGVFLVNTFICTLSIILSPILALKSFKEKNKEKGFKEEIIIIFLDEKISLKEGTYSVDIGYDNILSIHRLDLSTVFMLSKTNGLIVNNSTFTKGSLDECIALVQKNGSF